MTTTAMTAAELRARPLGVRRFGGGYDVAEVDAFLERAADALDGGGTLTPDDVHAVRFTQRWRRGYDVTAVDDLLDGVADALRRPPPVPRHAAGPA